VSMRSMRFRLHVGIEGGREGGQQKKRGGKPETGEKKGGKA
jgi:hypothetical protein